MREFVGSGKFICKAGFWLTIILLISLLSPLAAMAESAVVANLSLQYNLHGSGGRSLVVSWAQNTEPDFFKYVITVDGTYVTDVEKASAGYPLDLPGGKTYVVKVSAINNKGQTMASATASMYLPGRLSIKLPTWEKQAGSYYKTGEEIFSFTPAIPGARIIRYELPFDFGHSSIVDLSKFTSTDLVLKDDSGAVIPFIYTGGSLTVMQDFVPGKTYTVAMSSTSEGNEIKLPNSVTNYGMVSYQLMTENRQILENISLDGFRIVDWSWMKGNKDGIATMELADGEMQQYFFPIYAVDIVGDNGVVFISKNFTLELPKEVFQQLKALLPANELKDAQIRLYFEKVTLQSLAVQFAVATSRINVQTQPTGNGYRFSLSAVTIDKKETVLTTFEKPITLRLKVDNLSSKSLLGVYDITNTSSIDSIQYIGGKLVGDMMEVDINQFSKYAVLEYSKSFTDVQPDHWAYNAIRTLTAKHVINGMTDTEFAPEDQVTRGQFAVLLSRALGLKPGKIIPKFRDVRQNAYYYNAVAAAYESGLIKGRSEDIFDPDATISREEMASLAIRAYEFVTKSKVTAASRVIFFDQADISDWAAASVNAAVELKMVSGHEGNLYDPHVVATRAESAKAIAALVE